MLTLTLLSHWNDTSNLYFRTYYDVRKKLLLFNSYHKTQCSWVFCFLQRNAILTNVLPLPWSEPKLPLRLRGLANLSIFVLPRTWVRHWPHSLIRSCWSLQARQYSYGYLEPINFYFGCLLRVLSQIALWNWVWKVSAAVWEQQYV